MDRAAHPAAERVARESYGRLLAFLAARTRDLAGAEDALAEAFASALEAWPRTGVPAKPEAWLLTVARRRQTDVARRRGTETRSAGHLQMISEEIEAGADTADGIPDRRLALMFACAHPAIAPDMRAPLILQTLLGIGADRIGQAFLVPPATMGQRLVRAKARIRDAGIPLAVPDRADLPARLDAILAALYAAYTMGWEEIGEPGTPALAQEAVWLARVVTTLLPDEPEAQALLALMLYAEARRPARRAADGGYVTLEEQDTALWDRAMLAEAEALLLAASASGPSGRVQIEAAIQSAHFARRLGGVDTWPAIVSLYRHLEALTGSPVATLNRIVAEAETGDPDAALVALAPLLSDGRLKDYQPLWAAKGHFCALAARPEAAAEAWTRAIGLSADPAIRRYLGDRLAGLAHRPV